MGTDSGKGVTFEVTFHNISLNYQLYTGIRPKEYHLSDAISRVIKFYSFHFRELETLDIPITIPKKVQISLNTELSEFRRKIGDNLDKTEYEERKGWVKDHLDMLNEYFKASLSDKSEQVKIARITAWSVLLNSSSEFSLARTDNVTKSTLDEIIIDPIKYLKKCSSKINTGSEDEIDSFFKDLIEVTKNATTEIPADISILQYGFNDLVSINFEFSYEGDNDNYGIINRLLNIYPRFTGLMNANPLLFQWRQLSSGEIALNNFFGSIEDMIGTNNVSIQKNNLILLFDEVDNNLHPEWQRRIIDILVKSLPNLYPDWNIQLIVSSHSPIVLSDMPAGSVIKMKKDKEKIGEIEVKNNDQHKTFGANIHELYKDSFFMESLMGEFAKSKLEDLIKDLKKKEKESSTYTKEDAMALINTVGNNIIRNRLLDMYRNKFGLTKEDKEVRREQLRKEIEELNDELGYD